MLAERMEDTDGYAGLYGEVVTEDCYRLKKLNFIPDVIFDLGANIGVFTRYARSLFPAAYIIAVEPNPDNIANFKTFTDSKLIDHQIILFEKAIGTGQLWWYDRARNGTGEVYISDGPAYPSAELEKDTTAQKVAIATLSLPMLLHMAPEESKIMVKIDIEGNEQSIFADMLSMRVLTRADFIAMELHPYAIHGGFMRQQKENQERAIDLLRITHSVEIDETNHTLYATKLPAKPYQIPDQIPARAQ